MFKQNRRTLGFDACPVTILLVGGALVTFSSQGLCAILQYERSSILSGEIWRLFTGHLVHFSKEHLLLDLACIAVAGWSIERRRYPKFGLMCVVSALAVGLASLLFLPDMFRYGGLSAIGVGAITYLCLFSLNETTSHSWVYWVILFLTALKIVTEIATGTTLFASRDDAIVVPVPLAHFTGVVVASLFFLKTKLKARIYILAQQRAAKPRGKPGV